MGRKLFPAITASSPASISRVNWRIPHSKLACGDRGYRSAEDRFRASADNRPRRSRRTPGSVPELHFWSRRGASLDGQLPSTHLAAPVTDRGTEYRPARQAYVGKDSVAVGVADGGQKSSPPVEVMKTGASGSPLRMDSTIDVTVASRSTGLPSDRTDAVQEARRTAIRNGRLGVGQCGIAAEGDPV
jgi:hypothetical protein